SAPSVIGENLLVRFDSTLCCYRFSPSGSAGSLRNRIAREEPRLHKLMAPLTPQVDPVDAIFTAFENDGQQAALKVYADLRQQKKLTDLQRIAIAEAAYQQGMKDVAMLVMKHAQRDLPKSKAIQQKMKQWTGG
ncbi:MAG: hypothetical protein AB8G99_01745, partial [Planctomycetaceae bacterium]